MIGPVSGEASVLDDMAISTTIASIWILCFVVTCLDGFDLTLISFIAPHFKQSLGLPPESLGLIFSASLLGMALGGALFGWLGDRHGRKPMIVGSCVLLGLSTLALFVATTATQIVACRFITGMAMSGAIPNVLATAAEFTPARLRSRVLALIGIGMPLGATLPGLVVAAGDPVHSWQTVLLIGGIAPLAISAALVTLLPESLRFLGQIRGRRDEAVRTLARLAPGLDAADWIGAPPAVAAAISFSPRPLFIGGLGLITSLLWGLFFLVAMVNFLVNNWLPILLSSSGITVTQIGFASAMWSAGGLVGGLCVAGLLGRHGIALIAAFFMASVAPIVTLGSTPPFATMVVAIALAGLSVGAIQIGLNSLCGSIYPTMARGRAVGWALTMGRLGGISGPLLGGFALSSGYRGGKLLGLTAIPLMVGSVIAVALSLVWLRRHGAFRIDAAKSPDPHPGGSSGEPDLYNEAVGPGRIASPSAPRAPQ